MRLKNLQAQAFFILSLRCGRLRTWERKWPDAPVGSSLPSRIAALRITRTVTSVPQASAMQVEPLIVAHMLAAPMLAVLLIRVMRDGGKKRR